MTHLIVSMLFIVTAYCDDSCGKSPGHPAYAVMANGERTHWGAIACPPEMPFGTRVWLGGEWFTCKDRGGGIEGNRIDVWFPACEGAMEFGVKETVGGVR